MPDAYISGLRMLARRELSEAQLRQRLSRRSFEDEDVAEAVARLRRDGALDDRRTALACARTEAQVKRRGRHRVLRQVESLGIDRAIARDAVAEVFAELDEEALLAAALDRRLRHEPSIDDPAALRRLERYLVGQGFDSGKVRTALRTRAARIRE